MKWIKKLINFIIIVTVLFALLFYYFNSPIGHKKTILFEIENNESPAHIAKRLKEADFIRHHLFFYYYSRVLSYVSKKQIQKGKYRLSNDYSTSEILERFIKGMVEPDDYRITIPEGYNIYDIAKLLFSMKIIKSKNEFIKLAKDKKLLQKHQINSDSVEGYLYPSTYFIPKKNSAKVLINKMLTAFDKNFPKQEFNKKKAIIALSKHDLITLASLIEKETGVSYERGLVASVFHNRLKRQQKLECDPTVIYALIRAGKYRGSLSRKRGDLDIKSPYNTYLYNKLPPSPIANPSKASILAALNPETSTYLYFVAKDDKSHIFASTYEEHNRNVGEYKKRKLRNKKRKAKRK